MVNAGEEAIITSVPATYTMALQGSYLVIDGLKSSCLSPVIQGSNAKRRAGVAAHLGLPDKLQLEFKVLSVSELLPVRIDRNPWPHFL